MKKVRGEDVGVVGEGMNEKELGNGGRGVAIGKTTATRPPTKLVSQPENDDELQLSTTVKVEEFVEWPAAEESNVCSVITAFSLEKSMRVFHDEMVNDSRWFFRCELRSTAACLKEL
ncbi:hypothetical protein V6N12_020361 [Hibiscus sabdariffa]|uniref:Uncharacterized protein n=1 Tax=Hibiscus sabdariffa TaxID=183260 RepID=A0ABR2B2W7_9ROSI